ncbi:MAG: glycosyltransferase family 4 protein [Fimbriimonadaceae bacterium]
MMLVATGNTLLSGFRAPLLTAVIAMAVSWILTPYVRSFAVSKGAVDDPTRDDRRIHKEPLPRWGGLAIYAGILVSLIAVLPFAYPRGHPFPTYLIGILVIGAVLVVFGAMDDVHEYKARIQLAVLLGAGLLVQVLHSAGLRDRVQIETLGVPLTPDWIVLGLAAIPITAIYIFVITKTMDTIDGVDGLAAGIATIASGTLVLIAVYSKNPHAAIMAGAIAGSALGFLKHNYNPAKIIMGTGGAYILGFMLACVSIVGALKTAAAFSLIIPVLVFGVPIFDAFFVITRRLMSGQPITQADKRHLHHTLLKKGLSQRQTVWVLYAAAAMLCLVLLMVIRHYGHA